jgi:hypothetical protein
LWAEAVEDEEEDEGGELEEGRREGEGDHDVLVFWRW